MKSIHAMLKEATTVDQVRKVMNYANWTRPSGRDRRDYLAVMKLRLKELNVSDRV